MQQWPHPGPGKRFKSLSDPHKNKTKQRLRANSILRSHQHLSAVGGTVAQLWAARKQKKGQAVAEAVDLEQSWTRVGEKWQVADSILCSPKLALEAV